MPKKPKEKLPDKPMWTGDDEPFELENLFMANLKTHLKEAIKELTRVRKLKRMLTGAAATEPVADDLVAQRVTQGQARSWFVNAVAWWNARVLGVGRIITEHFSATAKCPDSGKLDGKSSDEYGQRENRGTKKVPMLNNVFGITGNIGGVLNNATTPLELVDLTGGTCRFWHSDIDGIGSGLFLINVSYKAYPNYTFMLWISPDLNVQIRYGTADGNGWQPWRSTDVTGHNSDKNAHTGGIGNYPLKQTADANSIAVRDAAGRIAQALDGSMADSGWCRLPGGLILQWMPIPGNANGDYILPIAFPNHFFVISATNISVGSKVSFVFSKKGLDRIHVDGAYPDGGLPAMAIICVGN